MHCGVWCASCVLMQLPHATLRNMKLKHITALHPQGLMQKRKLHVAIIHIQPPQVPSLILDVGQVKPWVASCLLMRFSDLNLGPQSKQDGDTQRHEGTVTPTSRSENKTKQSRKRTIMTVCATPIGSHPCNERKRVPRTNPPVICYACTSHTSPTTTGNESERRYPAVPRQSSPHLANTRVQVTHPQLAWTGTAAYEHHHMGSTMP